MSGLGSEYHKRKIRMRIPRAKKSRERRTKRGGIRVELTGNENDNRAQDLRAIPGGRGGTAMER